MKITDYIVSSSNKMKVSILSDELPESVTLLPHVCTFHIEYHECKSTQAMK